MTEYASDSFPDDEGQNRPLVCATPCIFDRHIAFCYYRYGEKPCSFFYNTITKKEVMRVNGALSTVAYLKDKDEESEKSYLVFQVNAVVGGEDYNDNKQLKKVMSSLEYEQRKICKAGTP